MKEGRRKNENVGGRINGPAFWFFVRLSSFQTQFLDRVRKEVKSEGKEAGKLTSAKIIL